MKSNYLIDREMNRVELLDSRFYKHEGTGEMFPSVTTILDAYPKGPAFYEWLKSVGDKADEIRDSFGKRGSVVHRLTEEYDYELEVTLMDEFNKPLYTSYEWAMFERYIEFLNRFKPDLDLIEQNFCSLKLGFGGTLDRTMTLNGEYLLVDIKTSNYLHNHFWLQQSAYVKMYEEINEKKIDRTAILWLNAKTRTDGKEGSVQGKGWQMVFSPRTLDEDWNLFKATYDLWRIENGSLKPKNLVYQLTHLKK